MGKIAGCTMMKDEEDVAYHVLAHMVEEGLDMIIVNDNMSTDGTRDELERAQRDFKECQILLQSDTEVGYYQSRKMTMLGRQAHVLGADWVIPFDADEIWYYREERLAVALRQIGPEVGLMNADLYNHFGTHLDPPGETPFQRMIWRQQQPGAMPKVAVRWNDQVEILQGNHGAVGWEGLAVGGFELRHFPYRSWEHFKRKAINGYKAYQATDLPEDAGAHWRNYGKLIEQFGDDTVRKDVFEKYFWFLSPTDEGLVPDPAPFRRWTR